MAVDAWPSPPRTPATPRGSSHTATAPVDWAGLSSTNGVITPAWLLKHATPDVRAALNRALPASTTMSSADGMPRFTMTATAPPTTSR